MEIEAMAALLKESLPPKRYKHSLAVYKTAGALAVHYGLSPAEQQQVGICALLHDCGREVGSKASPALAKKLGLALEPIEEQQPILLHQKLGAYYARTKYGVEDEEILAGIRYHTTGAPNMSRLAKLVFLADLIEPGRDCEWAEDVRRLSFQDLDRALLAAYGYTINHLVADGRFIHPDCIAGYNQLLSTLKAAKGAKAAKEAGGEPGEGGTEQ